MNTKLKGDLAEQAAVLQALRQGWEVLKPIGDRSSYDLVFDINGVLSKIQVKSAWFDRVKSNYVVDNRRTRTNRRTMVHKNYEPSDFDFALVYIDELELFYVFPSEIFIGYGSEIHIVEAVRRQRKPASASYRDAWESILHWAAQKETSVRTPVKFGEAVSRVIPSQAPRRLKVVEKV